MLFVDRLVCYYGEKQSCGPISFSLKKGQALGVRGINGAGKSSLLRALAGIKPPTVQGEIQFSGGEKSRFLVPEGRHLFGSLSVKENLLVTSSFLPKKEREAAMEELFSELPILSELSNRPAGLLSGGQMQLVAVARALLAKPALLLVDEPFLGLSPGAREEVTSLLIAQKRKGISLIFTCQDDPSATSLADLALVLCCGKQMFFGPFSAGAVLPLL
ncbi:MAG: ATP-binding cassette domain-containing protein [Oscillospiraceae bacterium]|nr:ATP-binding cassette domain-containing protein [Oscillospiraceae bacterium]